MSYHDLTAIARATGVLDDPDEITDTTSAADALWATITCFSAIFCLIAAGTLPQGAPL